MPLAMEFDPFGVKRKAHKAVAGIASDYVAFLYPIHAAGVDPAGSSVFSFLRYMIPTGMITQ